MIRVFILPGFKLCFMKEKNYHCIILVIDDKLIVVLYIKDVSDGSCH